MRRGIGRLRAGGSGFSPSSISFTSGLWLDQADLTTAFQDSAGTTPVTASGQQVGKRLDKSGRANHVLQATSAARPEYDLIGGISSDFTDGSDDGYSTATFVAGTLVAAMDWFITIKRATTANMAIASQTPVDAVRVLGAIDGTTNPAFIGAGAAFTCFVDGVAVGTAGTCTRVQLGTALGSGAYHVLELRDLDMSLWTQFTLGLYTSFMLNADIAQVILCPSQSAAIRSKLRTYCGGKGGISV